MKKLQIITLFFIALFFVSCSKKENPAEAVTQPKTQFFSRASGSAAFPKRANHTGYVFNGKIWLAGGSDDLYSSNPTYLNDVWSSNNGVDWTMVTGAAAFSKRFAASGAIFDAGSGEKMWLIGGGESYGTYRNDVWSSFNGADWQLVTGNAAFSSRGYHVTLVYNNKLWVIGGEHSNNGGLNDVWYSTDGADWILATGSAFSTPLISATGIVYANKMWIIGGYDGLPGYNSHNDIWSSTDGVVWTQVTSGAAFSKRRGLMSVLYNGYMWIICGNSVDAWRSADGITWTRESSEVETMGIEWGHVSMVFNNKIWVVGGYSPFNPPGCKNEVWSAQ